jgi:hypothetical protein
VADEKNTEGARSYQGVAEPAADLRALDRLVGTWELSGDVGGTVTYEWMEGGFFLIQHVALLQENGEKSTGMEVIGHERGLGAEREHKEPLLQRLGRHPRLHLRAVGGHPYDLVWGEGLTGVLRGHLERGRRHAHRRLALPRGRRLPGDLDQDRVATRIGIRGFGSRLIGTWR